MNTNKRYLNSFMGEELTPKLQSTCFLVKLSEAVVSQISLKSVCLLADWDGAQKRSVPFFAWSLLESVGLSDVQLQPDSKGKTA